MMTDFILIYIYALDHPPADIAVESVGDLVHYSLSVFVGTV